MNMIDILAWLDERVDRKADLCLDSRQLRPGDVFFACPGLHTDGRAFISQAVAAGAAAIVASDDGDQALPEVAVPMLRVSGLPALLGEIGHHWYGRPSDALAVIAVTGTNGKTSSVQWIAAAMNSEGRPCGSIGTLGVVLADGRNLGGVLTTPDALTIHRSLAAIARSGAEAAAIEASSIGIVQGRLAGVRIQVAGFTNLSRDHLDYHGTPENYKAAKFTLFAAAGLRSAVVNADDPAGRELLATPGAASRIGYSTQQQADTPWRAEDIHEGAEGLVFTLVSPQGRAQILTHLVGEHNIANLLLVAGVLRELGWGFGRIARALAVLRPVDGRMQRVHPVPGLGPARPQPVVIVDYAHTPDALAQALRALRSMAQARNGRLVCVFGCGGDRDAGKRPLMGSVAETLADEILLTSDNPRTEDPASIAAQIAAGIQAPVRIELDRAKAILSAVWGADERDVILLAGKGHETWQETGGVRSAFDDRQWAAFALSWQRQPSLSSDTRSLKAGEFFLALRGERFDGHDHLGSALRKGAAAALVAQADPAIELPQYVLGDTRQALQKIAAVWRTCFSCPVIAVTGSNGKTTTKEMIAAILAAWLGEDARLATLGNYNNDIGLPLTVLRLRGQHRAAVFELGMNHPGEIAVLARIAAPTIALVNNAQREHQEFMGTVEAVARENGAVIEALGEDGVAVFPGDDGYAGLWAGLAGDRRCLRFGFDADFEVSAQDIRAGSAGSEFRLCIGAESVSVALHAPGRHNLRNALAAAACAASAGAPLAAIARGLEAFRPVGGRMQPQRMADGFQLIDDSYNANPDSVRAAIDVLAGLDGRRILVLGDMGEVGSEGPAMHAEVGAYARQHGIDALLTLGQASHHAASAFGDGAQAFDALDGLLPRLFALRPAHVLVKGSRSMHMERVVQALQGDTTTNDKEPDHAA